MARPGTALLLALLASPEVARGDLRDATLNELSATDSGRHHHFASRPNGPERGRLNRWAWSANTWNGQAGCTYPSSSGAGDAASFVSCGPLPTEQLQRELRFRSRSHVLAFDLATLSLAVAPGGGPDVSPSPGQAVLGRLATNVSGARCTGPPDSGLDDGAGYSARLVRQGRYLTHYWIGGLTCGGAGASMELKVWPDCFELHLVLEDGTQQAGFEGEVNGGEVVAATGAGYATIAYCVRCSDEASTADCHLDRTADELSTCCPLGTGLCGPGGPQEACGALPGNASDSQSVSVAEPAAAGLPSVLRIAKVIHWAWSGNSFWFCALPSSVPSGFPAAGTELISSSIPTHVRLVAQSPAANKDASHGSRCAAGQSAFLISLVQTEEERGGHRSSVELDLHGRGMSVTREGAAWKVHLPNQKGKSLLENDEYEVVLRNAGMGAAAFRVIFHVVLPRGVTGIAALLRNSTDRSPSGVHVQISKNWHKRDVRVPYDGTWYSAIVMLEVPSESELRFDVVLVYQYFNGLHGVSHAQLSLTGWGTNGLWEEVGLGSAGEAICYEPDGEHRRQLVTDTRPFLVCAMGSDESDCKGTPDATAWTDNHGGSDFLAAFNSSGSYQYLTDVTTLHTANGPRITNATYKGVTVDGKVAATRMVSTWSAQDYARHLHSFNYSIREEAEYPRLILYQLGADNYNYVQNPLTIVYGNRDGALGNVTMSESVLMKVRQPWDKVSCSGPPPCWFALLTPDTMPVHYAHRGLIIRRWEARLGGVDRVPGEGFAFTLIGTRGQSTGLELGLPPDVEQRLLPGDFISADIELVLFPKNSSVYIGTSERLRERLDAVAADPWELVHQEAVKGAFAVEVSAGRVERHFPPRIQVDSTAEDWALFKLPLPADWHGVLPLTISNAFGPASGRLWRWGSSAVSEEGAWSEASAPWDLQVDRILGGGFDLTYSLQLEGSDLAAATAAAHPLCFAFSLQPPSESCEASFQGSTLGVMMADVAVAGASMRLTGTILAFGSAAVAMAP